MDGSVTQITSVSTAVTLNVACGRITTFNSAAPGGTGFQFTVNNAAVDAESVIVANIVNYTGAYLTNGIPLLVIGNVVPGSFVFGIYNQGANAFNGAFTIGFQCL